MSAAAAVTASASAVRCAYTIKYTVSSSGMTDRQSQHGEHTILPEKRKKSYVQTAQWEKNHKNNES